MARKRKQSGPSTVRCYNLSLGTRFFWGWFRDARGALPYIRRLKERLGPSWEFRTCWAGPLTREPGERLVNSTFAHLVQGLREPTEPTETETETEETETETETETEETESMPQPEVTETETETETPNMGPFGPMLVALLGYLKPEIQAIVVRQVGGMIEKAIEAQSGPRVVHHDIVVNDVTVTPPEGLLCHTEFARLLQAVKIRTPSLWITGDAGLGKTTAMEQVARIAGADLYWQGPVETGFQYWGHTDGHGKYHETPLYRWATGSGLRILALDEIDGSSTNAQLSLNLLISARVATFPNGETVHLDQDALILATANTVGSGPTLKYCGRYPMDRAFVDRFDSWIHWGLDEALERGIALAKFGNAANTFVTESQQIRASIAATGIDVDWSPRRTYAYARWRMQGLDKSDAARLAGLSRLDDQQISRILG